MKILLILIIAFAFASCEGESETTTETTGGTLSNTTMSIKGAVQLGPLAIYAQGTLQGLDSNFSPIVGESATVETSDILGNYASGQVTFPTAQYVKATFVGPFFNENLGAYTADSITISSLVFDGETNNINHVTAIIQDRVKALIQSGKAPTEASVQASDELIFQALGVHNLTGAHTWTIDGNNPLLLFAVLSQHGKDNTTLQGWINNVRSDFADGNLSAVFIAELKANAKFIDEATIAAEIQNTLGIAVQSYTTTLNSLDPSRSVSSVHAQGTGAVSAAQGHGGAATYFIPFVLNQTTNIDYIALECVVAGIKIHDNSGAIQDVYDPNFVLGNIFVNIGTQLATATYQADLLPLRDYGAGTIRNHQAKFATTLTLNAGIYWLEMTVNAGCVLNTYEDINASTAQYVVFTGSGLFTMFDGTRTPKFSFLK